MKRRGQSLERTRHSSLEMPDPELVVKEKKKQDMLTKARNKFFDAIKSRNLDGDKKSRTQATIDYLFKPCPNSKNDKNQIYSNSRAQNGQNEQNGHTLPRTSSLQKQHSIDSYPLKIAESVDDQAIASGIFRNRPATVCVDKLRDELGTTEALALERPRKKISFREPDLEGYLVQVPHDIFQKKPNRKAFTPEMKRSGNLNIGTMKKAPSIDLDDPELKSQAMRIVRTVGQAFEVCHKMAITAPENENDYDEQDTCTQDDGLSDLTADKPKRDLMSEGASDKASLPDEHNANKDMNGMDTNNRQYHVDLLSVPTLNNNSSNNTSVNNSANNTLANSNANSHNNSNVNLFQRKSPMDTFSNPHNDNLLGGGTNLNSTGNAISAQHEIQLLREQLEQQSQQTQAAMAQLQLTREQLAAEQSARMEAQSRTHQLLVHNRELLDHIAALVAHLQGGEKVPGQQSNSPHVAMPQQSFNNSPEHQDHSALDHTVLQALGLNPHDLIENPMVTSRLPSSPLRTSFNPQNNLFNFPMQDFSLETQLLQRLQTLCGYTPPQYNYMNQPLPFLSNLYGQGMVNNNYTLQPPPQKRLPPSPLAVRHSYSTSPIMDSRISPSKNDSLQNIHQVYQAQQNLQSQNYCNQNYQSNQSLNQIPQQNSQHLQVQGGPQQRQSPQRNLSPKTERSGEPQFIKPLSQMGTLTTTDTDGRVRVIVPVPSADEATNMMSQMRLEDYRPNVPTITRSTSEKVPNRSELMSQVQRTAWARHTTK
nr:capon-like protein isoform X1 [Onthophagus taurus]